MQRKLPNLSCMWKGTGMRKIWENVWEVTEIL